MGSHLPTSAYASLGAAIAQAGGLGVKATLNLAVTDGAAMAFTRYSTEGPGNSLYFIENERAFPGAITVVSERLDGDPA